MYWYGSVSSSTIRSFAARTSAVTDALSTRTFSGGPGPPRPGLPVHDPDEPVGLESTGKIPEERDAVFHFLIGVNDDDGIQSRHWKIGVASFTESGLHVLQSFALDASLDRLEHLALDVLRVDDAVRTNASGQMNREPPRARPDVSHLRSIGDVEDVHDLLGLLPGCTVRAFEESEIDRREQATIALCGRRLLLLPRVQTRLEAGDSRRV